MCHQVSTRNCNIIIIIAAIKFGSLRENTIVYTIIKSILEKKNLKCEAEQAFIIHIYLVVTYNAKLQVNPFLKLIYLTTNLV